LSDSQLISRREAIGRAMLLLGGTLAASTLAGAERAMWAATPHWAPRTLTPQQSELVATIAEYIIPTTDTPGARAAGVHRFVDVMLTDYYLPPERDRFLSGLTSIDERATRTHSATFLNCTPSQQLSLVTEMDAEAYPPAGAPTPSRAEMNKMRDSLARPAATAPAPTDANRTAPNLFFRRIKELTVLGYYTSDVGATKELRRMPMGTYRGDIPYSSIGRAWS
jgi:gluconate 2-dehydrogenase gamma chain